MSWSLSLDRAPRMRKPTNFSDSTKYKDISNDDEGVKKKRGRPSRSTQEFSGDGSTQPRRRGRPPKHSRPQTPVNDISIPIKDEDLTKRVKYKSDANYDSALSPEDELSQDSDYFSYDVDYVYEYDYEYEKSDIPQEVEPNSTVENSIEIPSPLKNSALPKIPLKNLKKLTKSKSASISESILHGDDEYSTIQEIIGQYNPFPLEPSQPTKYLVKFKDRAYIHCRWLTRSKIEKYDEGISAIRKFMQKSENQKLIQSLSIPNLLVFPDSDVQTEWFQVDRIWFADTFAPTPTSTGAPQNSVRTDYYVKWKEIDYDSSTIENSEDIKNETAINEYKQRFKHMNPKKIPTRWVRPGLSDFKPITKRPVSKNGDVFRDYQMEGLNWLIKCWHEQRNSILGDLLRVGKLPTLICMLNYLSSQYDINGPFLVLSSSTQLSVWQQQFENWSNLNVVVLNGNSSSRKIIVDNEIEARNENNRSVPGFVKSDVILSTYDFLLMKLPIFLEIEWRYIIADDGYKMKNARGKVPQFIKQNITYEHITLLIEKEVLVPKNEISIFNLLNFVDSDQYNPSVFEEFCLTYTPYEGEKAEQLNKIVEPYLLCRDSQRIAEESKPKEETLILIEPSLLQKKLYIDSIKKLTDIFMKPITDQADAPLINLISDLRSLINHPMISNSSLEAFSEIDNPLVMASGKSYFVDQLLKKSIPEGQKVMIFSQLVRVLDVLEVYLKENEILFERIDATTLKDDRDSILTRYKSTPTPVFLFSSKPGSYQIDLNLFDIVVVYDNDNYTFHSEMNGTLYKLITNGSFEVHGLHQDSLCFDEHTIQYLSEKDYRSMDAQDIEVILRRTIRPMFQDSDEKSSRFFTKNFDELLEMCVKTEINSSPDEVLYSKQKKFWNEYLKPPHQAKASASETPDPVNRVKQIITSLTNHGLTKGRDQLDLLKCALTLTPPENSKTLEYLNLIVGDNSSDRPVHRFGASAFLIDKLAPKLFENVIFFARLHRALLFAARPDLTWPNQLPLWKDVVSEYTLMYTLDKYGFKQLSSSFEEAKELTQKQIEKKVQSLIDGIEKQYSIKGGFQQCDRIREISENDDNELSESDSHTDEEKKNDDNVEVPLDPNEWAELHSQIIVRAQLEQEEIVRLFEILMEFGIPITNDYKPDYNELESIASLNHIHVDVIEECVDDIIQVGLSLLQFENTEKDTPGKQNYGLHPSLEKVQDKFDNNDYRRIIFVCRLMEKLYSFMIDHEDLCDTSIFDNVKLPEEFNLNSSEMYEYLSCIEECGILDVDSLSKKMKFGFPLNSPEDRLRLCETIIDQVVSPKCISSTNRLQIFNYGRIVDSPNFIGKSCPYPVGFTSHRTQIDNIPDLPPVSFQCQIQAAGNHPVFVVSTLDNPKTECAGEKPLDAWKMIIGSFIGAQKTEEVVSNIKLSGDWLFGLTTPNVMDVLQEMVKTFGITTSREESGTEDPDITKD